MPILFEKKKFVVPGEILAEGDYVAGNNTYKEAGKLFSVCIGLANNEGKTVYVSALKSFYSPVVGDIVIGKIVDIGFSGWVVDVEAPYLATLRASEVLGRQFNSQKTDLRSIFNLGDQLLSEVIAFDRTRDILLTVRGQGLGKIRKGLITRITPTKIPRVIGRKGSMVNMLKKNIGCDIVVAQNGLILIEGTTIQDEDLAAKAIRKIELESHINGLTDNVAEMIRKEKKV
jgi:exosome complex component RRP4